MSIRDSVIVMSESTWDMFREKAMETASLQSDPIDYLTKFNGLDVKIDNTLPDNITEIWYRDDYELYKNLEKNNPELLDKDDNYE